MQFTESDAFKKECKKLLKKYRTLESDLTTLKKALAVAPTGDGSKHWNKIREIDNTYFIYKTRMMCRAVRGTSFRVIYLYDSKNIEILFIEMYFKGAKTSENFERIEEVVKRLRKRG